MANKHTQPQPVTHQRFVVTIGYILFSLSVILLIIGTVIPLTQILLSPHVRIVNVAVFMVALVVGSLVPTLVAYIFGDASTRVKNKRLHHYNGVLFGLLAYWVSMAWSTVVPNILGNTHLIAPGAMGTAIAFTIPVVIISLIVGILAYYYHRERGRQVRVVDYRPFQVSLFVILAVVLFIGPLQQLTIVSSGAISVWLSTVVVMGAILISYACLTHLRVGFWHKAVLAVIGVTLSAVTLTTISQFFTYMYTSPPDLRVVPMATMILAGLLIYILYIYITRQSYRK